MYFINNTREVTNEAELTFVKTFVKQFHYGPFVFGQRDFFFLLNITDQINFFLKSDTITGHTTMLLKKFYEFDV